MSITRFLSIFILVILAGCGTRYTYTYQGKIYDDEDDFLKEVSLSNERVKRAILPLPKQLTSKKLIVVFPSMATILADSTAREKTRLNRNLRSGEVEMMENIAKSGFDNVTMLYEVTKIRGIYSHVAFRESNTLTNALAPSAEYDTLVWYEEAAGMGQWFYSSAKFGRQVFTWDRTSKDIQENTNAYLSALEALSIRE